MNKKLKKIIYLPIFFVIRLRKIIFYLYSLDKNLLKIDKMISENDQYIKSVYHKVQVIHTEISELSYDLNNMAGYVNLLFNIHQRQKLPETKKNVKNNLTVESFEFYLHELYKIRPCGYEKWLELFENGKNSYYSDRKSNCSVSGNMYSLIFKSYIDLHAKGRLLDIGCGIYGKPVYLKDYPSASISAIEPLELCEKVDFEVAQGFCELLPWSENSFDTVTCATSLDHVLHLERSLEEIKRVLRPSGKFILWIASIKGAKRSNMCELDESLADKYHLFHFDDLWFSEVLNGYFKLESKHMFPVSSFDHVFYVLGSV